MLRTLCFRIFGLCLCNRPFCRILRLTLFQNKIGAKLRPHESNIVGQGDQELMFPSRCTSWTSCSHRTSESNRSCRKRYAIRFWGGTHQAEVHIPSLTLALFLKSLNPQVTLISDTDYPAKWPNLMTDLVAKMQCQDSELNVDMLVM